MPQIAYGWDKSRRMVSLRANGILKLKERANVEELKEQIRALIISSLELENITESQIDDSEPIFGGGLGLDSIDALELGVALQKRFGVKFSATNADNRKHFASVNALAGYIDSQLSQQGTK
jgi:acyl carrier protein